MTASPSDGSTASLAFASAFQATIWGYPLVITGATARLITQVPKPMPNAHAPINQLGHVTRVFGPEDRDVVSPNADTCYSSAVLDLHQGAALIEMPDAGARYHSLQMLDAYTNVFGYIGTRATGNRAGKYLIVGPGWAGEVPADVARVFTAPSPLVWMIGRTLVDGADDLPALAAFQNAIKLSMIGPATHDTPLWERTQLAPLPPAPPVQQIAKMEPETFFHWLGQLMHDNPPAREHVAHVAQFAAFGLTMRQGFAPDTLDAETRDGAAKGYHAAMATLREGAGRPAGVLMNGWNCAPAAGEWQDRFMTRAIIALRSLGQNTVEESIYLNAMTDGTGQALDGRKEYRLRFAAGSLPPAQCFWSITAYTEEAFLVPNALNRCSIGSRDAGLHFDPDGSIAFHFSAQKPATPEALANWLPVPPSGPFRLSLRLYIPSSAAINGDWVPPGLEQIT